MGDNILKRISIAALVAAAAVSLAGCGTAPRPLTFEESLWFGKASHPERYYGGPYYIERRYAPRRRHVIEDAPPFEPPPAGYRG